jgi:hypothetical protein
MKLSYQPPAKIRRFFQRLNILARFQFDLLRVLLMVAAGLQTTAVTDSNLIQIDQLQPGLLTIEREQKFSGALFLCIYFGS